MHQPHRQGEPDGKKAYMWEIYRTKGDRPLRALKSRTAEPLLHRLLAREAQVNYENKYLLGINAAGKQQKSESRSISRVLSRTAIPLRQPSLTASSNLPGSSAGHANGSLFGLAPSGVYLATDCYQPRGALLPHLFTLTGAEALRRLFSVALSVGSRLPGVTWHFALWSPDFPPSRSASRTRQRLSDRLSGRKGIAAAARPQRISAWRPCRR